MILEVSSFGLVQAYTGVPPAVESVAIDSADVSYFDFPPISDLISTLRSLVKQNWMQFHFVI